MENHFSHLNLSNHEYSQKKLERSLEACHHPRGHPAKVWQEYENQQLGKVQEPKGDIELYL